MPEFKCVDVGADCKGHFTAESTEDLVRMVAQHLKTVHKIETPSRTILSYVTKKST